MKKAITIFLGVYLNVINIFSKRIGGRQAFLIFCYPFKAKIKKEQQAFLDTGHQFKLGVNGADIQCYRWGRGPRNVLFIHGWQSNSFRWKKYIEDIPKDQFTLYSFDAPGHGNSDGKISNVPLFEKAIRAIRSHIGEVDTMVSHSIGSFSTLYFVDQNPNEQPKKVVSLATPNSIEDFLDYYFKTLSLSKNTVENFKSYFTTYVNKELEYFKLSNIIKNNTASGLIIHDEGDQTVTADYSKLLHSIWPKSELVITQGLGHKLRDKSIVNLVDQFLIS